MGGTLLGEQPGERWHSATGPVAHLAGGGAGRLILGWLVYRDCQLGRATRWRVPLGRSTRFLRNKYYFDEFYDLLFVQTSRTGCPRVLRYQWMDKGRDRRHPASVSPGAPSAWVQCSAADFDLPVINGFGDDVGTGVQRRLWRICRVIQTGRVQQYLLCSWRCIDRHRRRASTFGPGLPAKE